MRHARMLLSMAAAAALLASGCGPAAEDSPPAGDPAETAPADEDEEPDIREDVDETLRDELELAIADAADERGVTTEEIEVLRAEQVEWPDGAMGCPEEGEMYTQAIVPGYLIVLSVHDETLYYHGAEGEPPFHCEDPDVDAVPESD